MLIDLPAYTKTVSVTFAANSPTVDLSAVAGFISVNDLSYNQYGIVEQKDTSFIREAYPNPAYRGPVRYFAMQNNNTLLLGPTPDIDYPAVLEYFGKWPSLVDLGTNVSTQDKETFISQYFETALLNGAMYYASLYMRDSQSAQDFKQEMVDSLGLTTKFGKGKARADKAEKTNAANDADGTD